MGFGLGFGLKLTQPAPGTTGDGGTGDALLTEGGDTLVTEGGDTLILED